MMRRKPSPTSVAWILHVITVTLLATMLYGCRDHGDLDHGDLDHGDLDHGDADHSEHYQHDEHEEQCDHALADRIDIPPTIRKNLGITFAKVERRPVRRTLRLPGQFELRPKARREYHVMLPGRVELLVEQYQRVKSGEILYRLDSPDWRKMQQELAAVYIARRRSHAELDVAEATLTETQKATEFLKNRIENLAEAQVRQVELEAELATKRNSLPRLEAELRSAQMGFDAAHIRYDVLLTTASSVTGIPLNVLDKQADKHRNTDGPMPHWQTITQLTIRAEVPGIVDNIGATNRGWVETGDLVLDTLNPSEVRFHADALQADINLFRDGLPAKIVPPPGGSIDLTEYIDGTLTVGFRAHSEQRTIPIYMVPQKLPHWAKPGVTAYLEVFVDGSDEPQLAIPESCVIRDGLDLIFFRRDPHNPNEVIRVEADLGVSDGRWIIVNSGVKAGDEVVLKGVYPLMLASSDSDKAAKGGHFHADGTFHKKADH